MAPLTLSVQNISRSYGKTRALSNCSFTIGENEPTLVLGHNGSGKSTLLGACAGHLRIDEGSIARTGENETRIGYFFEKPMLYRDLTVHENLAFFGTLLGLASIDEHLTAWGLKEKARVRVEALSQGLRTLTSLARAFLGDPHFLFLDEPTSSLDTNSTEILLRNLSLRKRGVTLVSTHDISRVSSFASKILLLREGTLANEYPGSKLSEALDSYHRSNR